jgi:hypothetical protein
MRLHLPVFLVSLSTLFTSGASDERRKQDLQPAAGFLFERRPFRSECANGKAGREEGSAHVVLGGNQPPYRVTRSGELTLSRSDVPSLTITADPSQSVAMGGSSRSDWSLRYCATSGGRSEEEARAQLQHISMTHLGSTVSLNAPPVTDGLQLRGSLIVNAPKDAPSVIHASYAAVEILDMTGPVRVTAAHARATILDTTGQVDAAAFVVDFAGSRGSISLSAEAEINLKMTAARFEGQLLAWSQGPVRVLVPSGFMTPFQVLVNRPQDFVCRADFCSKVKRDRRKDNGLYVFTYAGDGATSPERMHLRSEQATVVIDSADGAKVGPS